MLQHAGENYEKRRIAIFIVICMETFSYVTFCAPVFTTFGSMICLPIKKNL